MENKKSFYADAAAAPYLAAGDGFTDDRAAIQRALDDACAAGGGEVFLPGGTYIASCIVLRTGVTLRLAEDAVLQQDADPARYVKPQGGGYVPYTPACGHNFSPEIKWSHNWYRNYPLVFAEAGTHGFALRGGTLRMTDVTDPERIIKIAPVGFYRCSRFEISDVHITDYHSYAVMPITCDHGVFRNLRIDNWSHGNGDGICMMNCRDMRVTGCTMYTGDDAVYIFSSYRDPRRSEWWDSDDPQPSENIEIDNNDLRTNHCKAFGMILWGIECPDREKVEVRNVYVHDNRFETLGNWNYNPYTMRGGHPPVTDVRFENNEINAIEQNFFETYVSNLTGFRSMPELLNGHFEDGRAFWSLRGDAGVVRIPEDPYGRIAWDGDRSAALTQGLYLEANVPMLLRAETRGAGKLTVRRQDNGAVIAAAAFGHSDWRQELLAFTVPAAGNYIVGLERGDAPAGEAEMRHVFFGGHPAAEGSKEAVFDRGKILYKF